MRTSSCISSIVRVGDASSVLRRAGAAGLGDIAAAEVCVNGVLGGLLPLAVAVAISPVPIIAAILMLLSPKAGATSIGFLVGWVVGIVVATVVFVLLAGSIDQDDSSTATGWVKVVLGVLLLLLARKQWRGRPAPGETASVPGWMKAIDSLTFLRASGLGFALSAINPKNLMMCIAAGAEIGAAALTGSGTTVAVVVFTVIAASTVAVPVIGYVVARERLAGPLDELKVWLEANNATVMAVLLLVIGVVVLGKGIAAL